MENRGRDSTPDGGKPIPAVGTSRYGAGPIHQQATIRGIGLVSRQDSWRDGRREMKQNKVVVHFSDGRILKGRVNDFRPNKAEFHLVTLENEIPLINVADVKAVFFVKDHEGVEDRQDSYDDVIAGGGRRVKVTFSDGEEMTGYVASYSTDRAGFFLLPADLGSNNERVFVVASSCEDVEFL